MIKLHALAKIAHSLDEIGSYETAAVIDGIINYFYKAAHNEMELKEKIIETKNEINRLKEEILEITDRIRIHKEILQSGNAPYDDEEQKIIDQKLKFWPKIIEMLKERMSDLMNELRERQEMGTPPSYDRNDFR
jgi:dsDNA-specific endonuclease/ATPase MutS2